ncbi:MAG TPA: hypothetical protein RMH85_34080 [Polyangiaceae bacterium LLY-WYZ-15_(1-7)]|nr:hypothetical protein [Myxococcales bacterium]MAT24446.1 hypothetical protein [Sandaracinus sp.]HJK93296.1 hypothetical protein [Polyangiaceae bacterium LLY-WYZ-15_(1-7)]MBJ70837.1 hypothetical protein [Sandaracinus sp.]HJL00789.1 hypothetical protein [Polyangiaceae bacterium LLY-WYZ-15_(1-7)]
MRSTPPDVVRPLPGGDLRCRCHRLLARVVDEGIEMRCARCKQSAVLRWDVLSELRREPAPLELRPDE